MIHRHHTHADGARLKRRTILGGMINQYAQGVGEAVGPVPVSMMFPARVSRLTIATQSRW
jgi:hypothetical protein